MENKDNIYQSYVVYESGNKSGLIELRDEQKEAVKAAKDYFEKSPNHNKFLWNAKMRFGKTFCAMELAIEMGESEIDPKGKKDSKPINRVLIVTHRPVVKDGFDKDLKKLQDSLREKGQLHREWGFGTRSDEDNTGDYYDLEEKLKQENAPYVFFSSTQWLCYSKEVGGQINDPLRKSILNTEWDLIVIDEAHEGIIADRGSVVISKLTKARTKVLYMSGTPFNLLEGTKGFSEEQIYSWDYIQEQKSKLKWPDNHPNETNPYQDLPKMNIFAFDMGALIPGKDYKKGDMFSFKEMFRTYKGRPEIDDPAHGKYQAEADEIGKFVHEEDVKKFLDLMYLGDEKTNYPYTKEQYQENFRHTLWIVPGVPEAKALEDLLNNHPLFGSDSFNVVNVAGNNEDAEGLDDLSRVKDAITKYDYTITISCGKLTTGVTIPEWTAVFYMKGSADSSPATYMQTIFRVQSPHIINGQMKANCYVFDFAPGRSLKVVAETAKFARKTMISKHKSKIMTQEDAKVIKDFTKYCPIWQPVVINEGSELKRIDTDKIIEELNKVYIERIVKNGFDDYNIYLDDEILKLTDDIITETKEIVDNIPGDDSGKKTGSTEISNDGGLTTSVKNKSNKVKQTDRDKWQKEVDDGKTTDDFDTWFAKKEEEKAQKEKLNSTRKLIHAITKRIPLLMFGAEVDDEKIGITIDNITKRIDDASWTEFMPKGATKAYFEKIKHCYNDAMFKKAGTMIRDMARSTDEMHIEDRIARIAEIFNYFKNPDKETVLTPWPVVNMHMSQTLGGDCFFDQAFKSPNKFPREVVNENITKELFANIDEKAGESRTKILEINSKTGLYPLYVAYSLYRPLLDLYKERHAIDDPDNVSISEERAIWNTIIKKNIYVICNTDMAARITYRTLAGYRPIRDVDTSTISKEHYVKGMHIVSDKLVEKAIADKDALIKEIKTEGYWYNNKNNEKEMKFDAVVGNPPYQETSAVNNRQNPIYHYFYDIANSLSDIYTLISPARFLFNAGLTPAEWNQKMLNDEHLKVVYFTHDSKQCFTNVEIKGGVTIILKNANEIFKPIKRFVPDDRLQSIATKFNPTDNNNLSSIVFGGRSDLKFNNLFLEDYPQSINDRLSFIQKKKPTITELGQNEEFELKSSTFEALPYIFEDNVKSPDEYYHILGLANTMRKWKYIKRKYMSARHINNNIDKYKVFIPEANGNGVFGEQLGKTEIGYPGDSATTTFISIGAFETKEEAINCSMYLKTKFLRCLLGILKITQHTPPSVWAYIPLQDFTQNSDIRWNSTISEIDKQLYKKYELELSEQEFIENNVAPME